MTKRKRISRRAKPTVWQALNEPVVEVSDEFAKNVFLVAVILLMAAWLLPYWVGANPVSAAAGCDKVAGASAEAEEQGSPLIYEPFGPAQDMPINRQATVSVGSVPALYYAVTDIPGDVADAFAIAATDVLDISEPVSDAVEFYEPGVSAVWDAWLELMMDPYSTNY